jgi:hypothetical protein
VLRKTVVYFDQNAARRLALELAFKNQDVVQLYVYESFSQDSFRLEDLRPTLIITDQDYGTKLKCECWVLGREILLPLHPIELKNRIFDQIQKG